MAGLSTPHQLDHPSTLAAAVLTDDNRLIVMVIAAVAVAALVLAWILVRQVLAAGEGTDSMKKIAAAVQEGANAYLGRQMRTLGVFAVVVFFLLMLLPADDWNQRAGRSIFFLIGAAFSVVWSPGTGVVMPAPLNSAASPGRSLASSCLTAGRGSARP